MVVGKLKNDGELLIPQINTRLPLITDGLVSHYPFDNSTKGVSFTNMIDTSTWVIGSSGSQVGFSAYGDANQIMLGTGPFEEEMPLWQSVNNDVATGADGGWLGSLVDIDKTKKYRFSVWVKREVTGNGLSYFGVVNNNNIYNIVANTANTNPYFWSGNIPVNEWLLFVGYVFPHDIGNVIPVNDSGFYRGSTRILVATPFKFSPTAVKANLRVYLHNSTIPETNQRWVYPRMDLCDGTECSLEDLQRSPGDVINPAIEESITYRPDYVSIDIPNSNRNRNEQLHVTNISPFLGRNLSYKVGYVTLPNIPNDFPEFEYGTYYESYNTTGTFGVFGGIDTITDGVNTISIGFKVKFDVLPSQKLVTIKKRDINNIIIETIEVFNESNLTYIDDGWYRFTYVDQLSSNVHKYQLDGYEDKPNRIWIEEVALEDNHYPTAYNKFYRTNQGKLAIYNQVKTGNYTIHFEYKTLVPTGTVAAYNTIMSMGDYSTTNSWTIMDSGNATTNSTQRLIRKGNLNEWTWLSSNLTTPETINTWNIITLVRDSTNYKVYVNGEYKESLAHLSETMQDLIWIGTRQNGTNGTNAMFRNLSIYKRVLSDDEIKKLAKGTHSFNKTELMTKSIYTKSVIPQDVYYFDLGISGIDENNVVLPTIDTADYSDGTAYVGGNKLEFNFNESIGLNWAGDWTICYMKKPIGTQLGETTLTGYNVETFGRNSNSVGGGYLFWGKNNGQNIITSSSNGAFTPSDYFDKWQYVTLVKSGTTLTINTWLDDGLVRSRTVSVTTSLPNYYVNQNGYDFKLSGWDGNTGCYAKFKNLVVAKRAFTQQELDDYRLVKMRAKTEKLQIQSNINTINTL